MKKVFSIFIALCASLHLRADVGSYFSWSPWQQTYTAEPLELTEHVNQEFFDVLARCGWDYDASNEVLRIILRGGQVNAQNKEGMTPLMAAAQSGCAQVMKLLLQRGADVDMRDNKGRTALSIAVSNPNKFNKDAMVNVLLTFGPSQRPLLNRIASYLGLRSDYSSDLDELLRAAVRQNNPAIVIQLLKAGAQPYKNDSVGKNALNYAAAQPETGIADIIKKFTGEYGNDTELWEMAEEGWGEISAEPTKDDF